MSKPISKKTPAKKAVAKKAVKTTGNKVLDGILTKITQAKKDGEKSVSVFTTNRSHHKAKVATTNGLSHEDLKPKVLEAYNHIFRKYNVSTKLISIPDFAIEWIVKF